MTAGDGVVEVRVEGARKRDAGRGIARLSNDIQRELGILSGDPVIIEDGQLTVAKVWPSDEDEPVVRIDGDTRASIDVNIGDTVTVRKASVENAQAVTLQPATDHATESPSTEGVRQKLIDRLVRTGKRLRIEGYGPYVITDTRPTGSVKVTDSTTISVNPEIAVAEDTTSTESADEEITDTGTTYEDIGGLDEELDLVREMIELPLSEPELFTRLGIEPPKGVLLYGPPGTGKTLIARAVANEVDAYFETIDGPEIVSKYKGQSEEQLRAAFERARENAPSILFLDEIDSIAGSRDDDADMENRVVAQLLTLLDGLEQREQIIVIGATNRVDTIDEALRRGGRFDREIEIGVPSESGRREILDVHTRNMPLNDAVDLDKLAGRTHGFVGADLDSLTREAGMVALRRTEREARDAEIDTPGERESGESSAPDDVTEASETADGPADSSADDAASDTNGDVADESAETEDDAPPSPGDLEVTGADFETALTGVEPSAMREYIAETPETTFDDVGGLEETTQRLREAVEWPLAYGPLFDAASTDPPAGVLLYGPPGTGKTLLAEAIAGESGVNFVQVAGPELLDRYVGETEKAIRELFERARQTAPAIIFLDEIDAIATRRGEGHEVTERVVSQLLTEMDRAADHPKLVIVAATNRRDSIDPALLRPGRLEQHIEVPNPDQAARREILGVHTRETPLGDDVDLDSLAADLEGYSGAQVEAIVREASMRAVREVATNIEPAAAPEHTDDILVTAAHFKTAKETFDEKQ